jgi:prevent-host-death family protein
MKKIEMAKASGSLSEYAREARKNPIVVVKNGKPVAALVALRNADIETVSLSTSKEFLAIIERSRSRLKREGGISSSEIRRRLGLSK